MLGNDCPQARTALADRREVNILCRHRAFACWLFALRSQKGLWDGAQVFEERRLAISN